jgi:hypothetical protein
MPGLVEKCGQPTPQMKAECRCAERRATSNIKTKSTSYYTALEHSCNSMAGCLGSCTCLCLPSVACVCQYYKGKRANTDFKLCLLLLL